MQFFNFGFGLFESGNVLGNAESADDFTVVVIKRHFAGQRPGDVSIRPRFLLALADHRLAGADDFLFVVEGLLCMLLPMEVKVAFANGLVRAAQVEGRSQGRAATAEARFAVLEIDRVRRGNHQRLQHVPFAGQQCLCPPALGDVQQDALRADDRSIRGN